MPYQVFFIGNQKIWANVVYFPCCGEYVINYFDRQGQGVVGRTRCIGNAIESARHAYRQSMIAAEALDADHRRAQVLEAA